MCVLRGMKTRIKTIHHLELGRREKMSGEVNLLLLAMGVRGTAGRATHKSTSEIPPSK